MQDACRSPTKRLLPCSPAAEPSLESARCVPCARSRAREKRTRWQRPGSDTDAYRAALEDLIEREMRGETRNARRRKPDARVIDLMEALQASVDEAKKRRTSTGKARHRSVA